ncbi:MAG: hypothetical protein ACMXYC_00910 [Candidatus Woesearchaeota archaeon]
MNKKAVEMSMNVIIAAVLLLIILAVLTFIVVGRLGDFRQSTESCAGSCILFQATCPEAMPIKIPMRCKTDEAYSRDMATACCVSLNEG